VSVPFNAGAALVFAFPASALGRLAGLPGAVPRVYCALLAFFVLLFGGAYAWLARAPGIDRPLVAFATIGKVGVFAIICVLWALGDAPGRGVLIACGDFALAGTFLWWLRATRAPAGAERAERD
jgi:hypothetical protein